MIIPCSKIPDGAIHKQVRVKGKRNRYGRLVMPRWQRGWKLTAPTDITIGLATFHLKSGDWLLSKDGVIRAHEFEQLYDWI